MLQYKRYFVSIILCLSVFFHADCGSKKTNDYVWKIVDVDFLEGNSLSGEMNHDNCFLSISKDDSYIFFLNGYYSEGRVVKLEKEFKMLRSEDKKLVAAFSMERNNNSEATIHFTLFDSAAIQKTSNRDEVAHSVELPVGLMKKGFRLDIEKQIRGLKADPYVVRYNHWRIKPKHKESDKEIRERVKNHVEFMQLYFENALETGARVVSEPNLSSPFEIFSNGVSMRKFEEINDWQELFFDSEDAKKGYDIINNEMKRDFTLLKTKNAFELNADIFRKILKTID
jgi:hypothetical protein